MSIFTISLPDDITGFAFLFNSLGERIQCGSVVTVDALPSVSLLLKKLGKRSGTFVGDAVLLEDDQITVSVPLAKIKLLKESVPQSSRKLSRRLFDDAFNHSLELARKSFAFRKVQRENQLCFIIKLELQQLLCGKGNRKAVTLGLSVPEVDGGIFGLHPSSKRCVTFSYRGKNIDALDTFLGPRWDIYCSRDGRIRFITRVMFKLGKGDMLTCVAFAASSATSYCDHYRELLEQEVSHI